MTALAKKLTDAAQAVIRENAGTLVDAAYSRINGRGMARGLTKEEWVHVLTEAMLATYVAGLNDATTALSQALPGRQAAEEVRDDRPR